MFNSVSVSHSNSSSSAKSYSNVNNEINDYKPIVRSNQESKFKKIKIHSQEFDLIASDNPCIIKSFKHVSVEKCYYADIHCHDYIYQEIKVLSFNQISKEEMLIEYLVLGEKKDNLTIYSCGSIPKDNEIFNKIIEKLLTNKY
jgi:hypothetical protein